MRVAVFGLGYVGSVTAACLAGAGHHVVGLDPVAVKRADLIGGKGPVPEPGLDEVVADVVRRGLLTVGDDVAAAVAGADVCLVCVGTPSRSNGSLDLTHVTRVTAQIGAALRSVDRHVVVAVRSTVLPGTTDEVIAPLLEESSGMARDGDFSLAFCPEFLRESSAVRDFYSPPFTVVGTHDATAAARLQALLDQGSSRSHVVPPATAEALKYACNAFHAVKVTFANEIGRLCRTLGVDSREVMDIFCEDGQLNISARYLRPGFAFGGSCLPKDVRALVYQARHVDQEVPLLSSLTRSNDVHVQQGLDLVLGTGARRVALLGLSFKAGTDDLRESPFVRVAEGLLAKGIDLRIYDPAVNPSLLVGANRAYVEEHLPHLAGLLRDRIEDALEGAGCVVLATPDPAVASAVLAAPPAPLVDLSGGLEPGTEARLRGDVPVPVQRRRYGSYVGVAW